MVEAGACARCGGTLEPGFIEDAGQQSIGRARWIPGPLELGIFGGTKRASKPRYEIAAHRCRTCIVADGPHLRFASSPIRVRIRTGKPDSSTCNHLELFVTNID
jgi:hypothetical protein